MEQSCSLTDKRAIRPAGAGAVVADSDGDFWTHSSGQEALRITDQVKSLIRNENVEEYFYDDFVAANSLI